MLEAFSLLLTSTSLKLSTFARALSNAENLLELCIASVSTKLSEIINLTKQSGVRWLPVESLIVN